MKIESIKCDKYGHIHQLGDENYVRVTGSLIIGDQYLVTEKVVDNKRVDHHYCIGCLKDMVTIVRKRETPDDLKGSFRGWEQPPHFLEDDPHEEMFDFHKDHGHCDGEMIEGCAELTKKEIEDGPVKSVDKPLTTITEGKTQGNMNPPPSCGKPIIPPPPAWPKTRAITECGRELGPQEAKDKGYNL